MLRDTFFDATHNPALHRRQTLIDEEAEFWADVKKTRVEEKTGFEANGKKMLRCGFDAFFSDSSKLSLPLLLGQVSDGFTAKILDLRKQIFNFF